MDDSGSDGCMTQRQYEIIVLFLSQGYFPTKRELMEAHFANGEDTIRPRPFRKFKSWTQRLLYRESENALIHLPTGKIVVPKERFVDIIVANHCNDTGGHLTAYATMRKIQKKYTFGRRNFGMNEELVKHVVRNCPFCQNIRPVSTSAKQDSRMEIDNSGMQSEAFDCKRNYQEQTQEKDTEKCEATGSTCDAATNAQSEIGIKRIKTESQREQEDESMEWKPTETDRNKADVKQSHPIIHNTLLSQLKMAAGSNQSTSSSHNNPVPVPVLGPFSMSLLPSISSLNFATSLALAKTCNSISEHIVKSSCPSLSNKEPQVTVAKAQELNSNLGSILTQRPSALGYYVKVPNSASPAGFSLSYVSTPSLSLGQSTVCSSSIASSALSTITLPSCGGSLEGILSNKPIVTKKIEQGQSSQTKVAIPNLALSTQQSKIPPDRMQIHGKIIIPSVMKSSKPKVLPPIKPKENTELAKALLTPSENDAGTSSILSTPQKILKGASTNSSSKVSKKLKTKLDKLDKKIKRAGKRSKIESPSAKLKSLSPSTKLKSSCPSTKLKSSSPSTKLKSSEEDADRKDVNQNVEKAASSSVNPIDESLKKKKIIVINPERMKKLLEKSLKGLNMNMNFNFKGKCNVTFHNESSGAKTSFIVDDSLSKSGANTSHPLNVQQSSARALKPENFLERLKQRLSCNSKELAEKICMKSCEKLEVDGEDKSELNDAKQVTKQCLDELNNADLVQKVNSTSGFPTLRLSDKPSDPVQPVLPEPGPVPCPSMWTFAADMAVERNCYGRLLIAIQDMRKDVMKSILSDHIAIERLRKKISYAETLVNKHKSFISNHHKDLDLN